MEPLQHVSAERDEVYPGGRGGATLDGKAAGLMGHLRSTALGARVARVSQKVYDAGHSPRSAEGRGGHWAAEAGDEQGTEERSQVLSEVCVGSLGCSGRWLVSNAESYPGRSQASRTEGQEAKKETKKQGDEHAKRSRQMLTLGVLAKPARQNFQTYRS